MHLSFKLFNIKKLTTKYLCSKLRNITKAVCCYFDITSNFSRMCILHLTISIIVACLNKIKYLQYNNRMHI